MALHTFWFREVFVAFALLVAQQDETAFSSPLPCTLNSRNNRPACWAWVQGMMAVVGYAGFCNTGNLVCSVAVYVLLKYLLY